MWAPPALDAGAGPRAGAGLDRGPDGLTPPCPQPEPPRRLRRPGLRPRRGGQQALRRVRRRRRRVARDRQGRALRPARRLRLRQDHAAAHARRLRDAERRAHLHRRPGHDRGAALRAAGQHDVPVLRALPAHDRRAERRLRPEERARCPPQQRRDRVREMLDLVQLGGLGGRKPHQISGGQRQRVALARALAKPPKLLLLDEPLGALDKKLREHTQFELANIQYRTGITFVVVTHDQEEAMTLANRIAVMDRGRIRQIGTPDRDLRIPARPASSPTSSARSTCSTARVDAVRRRASPASSCPRSAAVEARARPRPRRPGRRSPWRSAPRRSPSAASARTARQRGRGRGRGPRLLRQGLALPRPPRLGPHPLGQLAPTPAASARTSASPSGRTGSGSPSTPPRRSCCAEERDA